MVEHLARVGACPAAYGNKRHAECVGERICKRIRASVICRRKDNTVLAEIFKERKRRVFQLAAESRHFGCGVNVQNILAQKVSLKAAEVAHTVRVAADVVRL